MIPEKIYIDGLEKYISIIEDGTIVYECDRRACRCGCNQVCGHTSDIRHAKNFKMIGKMFADG